jgi:DNA-binding NarL/FixJ family response regulator
VTTRLVLVDDHAVVREALRQILDAEPDLEVVGTADCGQTGLALVQQVRPDLVLLDIALPDADGLDLVADFLHQSVDLRVVMLSMHAEPEYAVAAVERGASGLISKADSPDSFLATLRRVAAGCSMPIETALTPRERDVLAELAQGLSNAEIAESLGLQPKTIEGYCQQLMQRLDLHTRVGLIRYARRLGL